MHSYSEDFFADMREGSRRSAREIVPLVLELVRPKHVIDVGCGVGTWLSVFRELGVDDVLGVDGDYVDRSRLEIPEDRFLPADLRRPLRLERRFDLVVSLEVAEHLPEESAEGFIRSLTGLADVVLFSAAIPFQGGTEHLNEQWPEYWASVFQAEDYVVVDCLRRTIWQNESVEYWYAQNTLLFVRRGAFGRHPALSAEYERSAGSPLSVVHPKAYVSEVEWTQRLYAAAGDLAATVPHGETFILVDQDELRGTIAAGYRTLPFLERDGEYWGPPPDDETAIAELERLRQAGANCIVFAWPAFWWLDHYLEFHDYLRSRFRRTLENDRLVAFDLRP